MAQSKTDVRTKRRASVGNPKSNEYQPRTKLGRELVAARRRIVASGEKLLSRAEVSREVKERRGGSIDE